MRLWIFLMFSNKLQIFVNQNKFLSFVILHYIASIFIGAYRKFIVILENQYKSSNRLDKKENVYVVNSNIEIIGVGVQNRLNGNRINVIKQNKGNVDKDLTLYKCSG